MLVCLTTKCARSSPCQWIVILIIVVVVVFVVSTVRHVVVISFSSI